MGFWPGDRSVTRIGLPAGHGMRGDAQHLLEADLDAGPSRGVVDGDAAAERRREAAPGRGGRSPASARGSSIARSGGEEVEAAPVGLGPQPVEPGGEPVVQAVHQRRVGEVGEVASRRPGEGHAGAEPLGGGGRGGGPGCARRRAWRGRRPRAGRRPRGGRRGPARPGAPAGGRGRGPRGGTRRPPRRCGCGRKEPARRSASESGRAARMRASSPAPSRSVTTRRRSAPSGSPGLATAPRPPERRKRGASPGRRRAMRSG